MIKVLFDIEKLGLKQGMIFQGYPSLDGFVQVFFYGSFIELAPDEFEWVAK